MNVAIGITDNHRTAIAIELSKILADETVLCIKTKNAHWNVEDRIFMINTNFLNSRSGNWMRSLIM